MKNDYQYKSHSLYVVQTIRKQPGIKGSEPIDDILDMLSDDEIARQIDKIVNSGDYSGPEYMRYTFEGAQLIARRCTAKADKIFTTLLAFANQGLRITISQADLAELSALSKPTVTAALKELESIYAIIIIPGDSRSGEADTYYINPGICACSRMSKQAAQEAVFWNLLKTEDAEHSKYEKARQARLQFKQLINDVMSEFEETFSLIENRDPSTREPLGITIEKHGKSKTQEQVGRRRKKKVSAANTDQQDTQSPTSHVYDNQTIEKKQALVKNNMLNRPQKTPIFDSEIPFDDIPIPGQMTFSDFPEISPEGVENEKSTGNDR